MNENNKTISFTTNAEHKGKYYDHIFSFDKNGARTANVCVFKYYYIFL